MEKPSFPPQVTLRLASSADYPLLARLLTKAHPDFPRVAEDLQRFADMRLPGEVFECVVAEENGKVIGMAEVSVPRMEAHEGWLHVEFAALQQDLALPLLAWAEAKAAQHSAHTLVTRLKENWWEKPVYEAHGYAEHDRMWPSTLDLTQLNLAQFAEQEARVKAAGVQLRPLSELGEFDEAQQRKLYDLITALLRDVPSTTPISVWPFEVWQHKYLPRLQHPEGVWLALAPGNEWIGISELHQPVLSRPGTLHNGLTGVLPEWRGKSIALALKLAAARAALARGFTHARTSNHSINAPILAVNNKLGFVREDATLTLKKNLR